MKNINFKNDAFEVISIYQKGTSKIKTIYNVRCNKCGKIYQRRIQDVKKFKGSGCLACTLEFQKHLHLIIVQCIILIKTL